MKLIREQKIQVKIKEGNKELWAFLYIEEYATIWSITCQIIGYALPGAQDWRYKKKEYPTLDSVINKFKLDYKQRWS